MMKLWVLVRLAIALSVVSSAIALRPLPVAAQEERERSIVIGQPSLVEEPQMANDQEQMTNDSTLQLNELEQPATTVTDWIAQIEASLVQITGVRVETTEAGLQVVLETAEGSLDVPETRSIGNALIADIPNATLAEEFSQAEPIEGIALVSVTQLPGDRVRVAITGTDATPVAEVRSEGQGLVLAVTLGDADAIAEEDAIQVVVTGEQDEGYNPSSATTATRTDTPLRDIPQSITVVPRQVLEDRNVRTVNEAVETVSSVARGFRPYGNVPIFGSTIIRGFDQLYSGTPRFRNGFRESEYYSLIPIGTVEQIEVLRGPASVLFGAGEPGGVINVITRQPLDEPYYSLAFEAGNYGYYQPSIDLSGPLTEDDTVLYRFIAGYQGSSDFQGFADSRVTTVAPSIALNLGERTDLNLYYEYTHLFADPPSGLTNALVLSDGSLTPRDFVTYYPDLSLVIVRSDRFGYSLEHEFSDDWRIRNNVAVNLTQFREDVATGFALSDDERFLQGFDEYSGRYQRNNFFGQIDVLGNFETGSISHQVLMGFDFNRYSQEQEAITVDTPLPPLDIRNPDYDIPVPSYSTRRTFSDVDFLRQSYGAYIQDQIALLDNLKLLIGGRYDWVSTDLATDVTIPGDVINLPTRNDGAFSPRVGLVYQPSEAISLYASYTRSFAPLSGFDNTSTDPDVVYEPSRGTQYEVGVKTDFLDGRLSATLAAYHLTRSNVLTPDPDDPSRSIQTGEQRSQGVEFDVTGEILPGWNVILSYAYTDAEVTEDNTFPEGNRLANVPENQASLWTTYTIQDGSLEGLGFGLGLFYVGARQGDLSNSFEMDEYFRTDAALYYRRGRFRTAINVRNLFDIDAAELSFGRALIQRTDPFSIVGSVSWEF
jgi:iron complex outermembrane recepter protein